MVDDLAAWQVRISYGHYTTKVTILSFLAGHEVVWLPVTHCSLNPTEMAWARVKSHIKANTKAFNLTEVERLGWEGFSIVTADRWSKLIKHVQEKKEDHYWACDGLYQQVVEWFIIQFGDGDSDSDDENDVSSIAESDGSTDDDSSTTTDQGSISEEDDECCCEHLG